MKSRASITVFVTPPGLAAPLGVRIVPKTSRYLRTRYWVVLPATGTRRERWRLVPDMKSAQALIWRWLAAVAKECLKSHEQDTH